MPKNPYRDPGRMGTHWEGCGRAHSECAWEEGYAAAVKELGKLFPETFEADEDEEEE